MTNQRVRQVQANSGHTEWVTPYYILSAVRKALNGIALDPASSTLAQSQVRAKRYFTIEDDALSKSWKADSVFLNPPYTRGSMVAFVDKIETEWRLSHFMKAIVLTNNATETKWAQKLARLSSAICLLNGRVAFSRPDGEGGLYKPKSGSLQGQMVWFIGNRSGSFLQAFRDLGVCFTHN